MKGNFPIKHLVVPALFLACFLAGYILGVGQPRQKNPAGLVQMGSAAEPAFEVQTQPIPETRSQSQTFPSATTQKQSKGSSDHGETIKIAWATAGKEPRMRPRVPPHPIDPGNQQGVIEGTPARGSGSAPVLAGSKEAMEDAVQELRGRNLLLPLNDLNKSDLRDSFQESRGDHLHQAIDILAPRNTPVLAVEDGTIAKLWLSVPGGITLYEFDPDKKYEYYYAHLESYAEGIKEGDHVKRGEVIGYVGTSGNAPKNTPHLHFTIFKLTEDKHWWQGTPINPYLVFR